MAFSRAAVVLLSFFAIPAISIRLAIGRGLLQTAPLLGAGVLTYDQWLAADSQHSAAKFAHFFSNIQNPVEIDGWHYVGGSYDGWYNTAPNPVLGQFDWARRASIPTAGQKRHGLPT